MLIAHYTSIETAFSRIIPSQKIKFGKLSTTNDPYEVQMDWHLGRTALGGDSSQLNEAFLRNEIERNEINKNVRICCFSHALNDGTDEYSCGNNTHLWTYYASAKDGIDQGCALIFDSETLESNIQSNSDFTMLHRGPIDYLESDEIRRRNGIRVSAQAFMIKPKRWQIENEYRIIVRNDIASSKDPLIDISGSLRAIVLNGLQMNLINDRYKFGLNAICSSEIIWRRRSYNYHDHEFRFI